MTGLMSSSNATKVNIRITTGKMTANVTFNAQMLVFVAHSKQQKSDGCIISGGLATFQGAVSSP